MSSPYDLKRGDNIADPNFWNLRFDDIDLRLKTSENRIRVGELAAENVVSLGLERVNNQLTPLVAMALAKIASVANLFEAGSASEVTIAASGQVTFTVSEADRAIWPLPSFVSASVSTDASKYVAGRVVSFSRETGALVLDIFDHGGSGTYSAWKLRISGLPGVKGDTGATGPKGDRGDLNGSASDLPATAPEGFAGTDVQAVLGSIAAAAAEVSGKAPTYHTHAQADVTGLSTALSGKANAGHVHGDLYAPQGTTMTFQQATAPAGWTKQTTHNDKALRVVSGTTSSGGSVAFSAAFTSITPTGMVAGHALTEAENGPHTHSGTTGYQNVSHNHGVNYLNNLAGGGGGANVQSSGSGASPTGPESVAHTHSFTTAQSGSGTAHSHGWTGDAINLAVA